MIPEGHWTAAKGIWQQAEKVKTGIKSQARDKVTVPM